MYGLHLDRKTWADDIARCVCNPASTGLCEQKRCARCKRCMPRAMTMKVENICFDIIMCSVN